MNVSVCYYQAMRFLVVALLLISSSATAGVGTLSEIVAADDGYTYGIGGGGKAYWLSGSRSGALRTGFVGEVLPGSGGAFLVGRGTVYFVINGQARRLSIPGQVFRVIPSGSGSHLQAMEDAGPAMWYHTPRSLSRVSESPAD